MNAYSDRPPLYYTCTTCYKCFSETVDGECPYCKIDKLKERLEKWEERLYDYVRQAIKEDCEKV